MSPLGSASAGVGVNGGAALVGRLAAHYRAAAGRNACTAAGQLLAGLGQRRLHQRRYVLRQRRQCRAGGRIKAV
jgi:hypothetical protein